MKRILFILSVLISGFAYGQTTGYFRYDTITFQKVGGNSELKILNATRGITGGVLTNIGGGRTAFIIPGSGGTGSPNTSTGSGFKIAVNGTNFVKSLFPSNGLTGDSATSGQVGVKWNGLLTQNTLINGAAAYKIGFRNLASATGDTAFAVGGPGINMFITPSPPNRNFADPRNDKGTLTIDARNLSENGILVKQSDWGITTGGGFYNFYDSTEYSTANGNITAPNYLGAASAVNIGFKNNTENIVLQLLTGPQRSAIADSGSTIMTNGRSLDIGLYGANNGSIKFGHWNNGITAPWGMFTSVNGFFGLNTILPTQQLTVNGQVRINNINNASVFDSVVVINNGVLEARLASTLVTAGGGGSGTVNSGTQYRIAYYATTGTVVSEAAAITAARALVSDVNGVPTHSTTTTTQLQYLNAATGTTGTTSTNIVFSTSPTLVTPILGTPTSVTLTNATGLPLTTGVTGVLPIANGGTNISTYTTGNLLYASATNVLSKLAIGTTGQVLTVAGGVPTWASPAASGLGSFYYDGTLRAINDSTIGGDTTRFRGKLATYHLVDSLRTTQGLQNVITNNPNLTANNTIRGKAYTLAFDTLKQFSVRIYGTEPNSGHPYKMENRFYMGLDANDGVGMASQFFDSTDKTNTLVTNTIIATANYAAIQSLKQSNNHSTQIYTTPDSVVTIGVKLSSHANDSMMVRSSSGKLGVRVIPTGGGSTPTFQQTLTAGSTLTGANNVDINGNSFGIVNTGADEDISLSTGTGEARLYLSNKFSNGYDLEVTSTRKISQYTTSGFNVTDPDSIAFVSSIYRFNNIPYGSIDTTVNKPLAANVNGKMVRMNSWAQVMGSGGGSGLSLSPSGIFPTRQSYQIPPQITTPLLVTNLELINLGNILGNSDSALSVLTGYGRYGYTLLTTFNMKADTSSGFKWISPVHSKPSAALEIGLEGVTFHVVAAGTNFSDTWHEQLQIRHAGVDGTTGITTGSYNQSKAPLYFKFKSGTYVDDSDPWMGGSSTEDIPFIWMHSEETKGTTGEYLRIEQNNATATGGQMWFRHSRGTYGTKVTSNSGDIGGLINFALHDGTNYIQTARLLSFADAAPSTGVLPQSFAVQTSATDLAGIATRLRVWGSGRVSVGTNTPTGLLTIDAGTTALPPLVITAGTNATTPVNGAIENNGTHLYYTTGGTRYQLDQQSGGGLTVGTSTITSGTTTRILYDNGGVLGEYTLTGTGTVVAMQTAPALTSPTITTGIVPTTNDGAALGSTTNQFSDLFLAEGGVINFDNGDATLTQVGNVVTLAGAGLTLTGGTLADQTSALLVTATIPGGTVSSANYVVNVQATSQNQTSNAYAFNMDLLAGATDARVYAAGRFANAVASTGQTSNSGFGGLGNYGLLSQASGTTSGGNTGLSGNGQNSSFRNIGVHGSAVTNANSTPNIGVAGFGLNAGSSPVQVGGYFGLQSTYPTFTSAALMADNGATTSPIFVARDNGTAMFSVNDGGALVVNTTTTTVGTTGAQTINKATGTVNIAAAGTTVTVTNSLVTASSIVYCVIRTNDATARISNVVPAAGSFTINIVASTAEVSIGFIVIN